MTDITPPQLPATPSYRDPSAMTVAPAANGAEKVSYDIRAMLAEKGDAASLDTVELTLDGLSVEVPATPPSTFTAALAQFSGVTAGASDAGIDVNNHEALAEWGGTPYVKANAELELVVTEIVGRDMANRVPTMALVGVLLQVWRVDPKRSQSSGSSTTGAPN
jgi:hypothetical protein